MDSDRYALGPDERPSWLHYPDAYLRLVDQVEVELTPWVMLRPPETLAQRTKLFERYPARDLVPFARRSDSDDLACWDRARPREVVVVHDFASPRWEDEGTVGSFLSWYRAALADMREWDDVSRRGAELDLPRHRRWLIAGLDDPVEGRAHCALMPRADGDVFERAGRVADEILQARLDPASLRELSRADAVAVATMIYAQGRGRAASPQAKALAEQFLHAFGDDARFFSPWRFEVGSQPGQWRAIGRSVVGASFELGFFALSAGSDGVLWVADED